MSEPTGPTYALCPYCGSTIQRLLDKTIRHHRGPDPVYPNHTYCRRGSHLDTTEWPAYVDSKGRTVHTQPGEEPGRLATPDELMDAAFGPGAFRLIPDTRAALNRRFEIRLKGES